MFCDPADTTRDRLLDTAERCFAEHGYQATTMRAVTTEAAANIAAVNYHFGS
jgi:AcrR family transcriptional regulator